MGAAVMGVALWQMKDWAFDPVKVGSFLVTFACGVSISYSFMLLLTALSVWMVRNQSLMEMWWLFSSLARYPKEIFKGIWWAEPISFFFTFVLPILLVVNVPANAMVRLLDLRMVGFTVVATGALFWLSRLFFLRALRSYRSASS
jgi:ABC-2 type transport system permease protein